jgi:hypothetical protein
MNVTSQATSASKTAPTALFVRLAGNAPAKTTP